MDTTEFLHKVDMIQPQERIRVGESQMLWAQNNGWEHGNAKRKTKERKKKTALLSVSSLFSWACHLYFPPNPQDMARRTEKSCTTRFLTATSNTEHRSWQIEKVGYPDKSRTRQHMRGSIALPHQLTLRSLPRRVLKEKSERRRRQIVLVYTWAACNQAAHVPGKRAAIRPCSRRMVITRRNSSTLDTTPPMANLFRFTPSRYKVQSLQTLQSSRSL